MDSLHFIQGGRNGVQLDSPMGSRVQGDTLWVLDVDKLRGFNTHTGAPTVTVDLAPLKALFLNDLAIDSTGSSTSPTRASRRTRMARAITPAPIGSSTSRTIAR